MLKHLPGGPLQILKEPMTMINGHEFKGFGFHSNQKRNDSSRHNIQTNINTNNPYDNFHDLHIFTSSPASFQHISELVLSLKFRLSCLFGAGDEILLRSSDIVRFTLAASLSIISQRIFSGSSLQGRPTPSLKFNYLISFLQKSITGVTFCNFKKWNYRSATF